MTTTNEHKKGYKKTKVGWIPVEWNYSKIKHIATKVTDGEHITPKRSESGYYLLSARNILDNVVSLANVDYVGEDEYRRIRKRCNPEFNDLVISCSGTIGRVTVVPKKLKFVMVRSAALVKLKQDIVVPQFVKSSIQSFEVQKQILRTLNQGAQANLFINHIEKLIVPLPPLPEQKKIAQILTTWDKAIAHSQDLIAQLKRRKKGLMQQLLTGKTRLKGFGGAWEEVRLGSFLTESRIKGNSGDIAKKITVKLYGKGVFAKDEKFQGSKNTQYYKRKAGQFIYSKLDFLNGAFGVIPEELNGFESTLDLPCFDVDKTKICTEYLLALVTQESFYKRFDGGAIGGRKAKRIQVKEFLSLKPIFPSFEEQKAIAQVLTTADTEIATQEKYLHQLQAQKKGLMQQLLTGAKRVKV